MPGDGGDGVEEWLRRVRAAAARAVFESASGPRGRIVECGEVAREGPALLCPGSWWRPRGVLGYVTVLEGGGVPVYRGPLWLEERRGGLLLGGLDLAAAEPRAPLRLVVHGYASPEELVEGVPLSLLGAFEEEAALCSGDQEAAARLMASVLGALLLWRSALPAPATWAPEAGPWLEASPGPRGSAAGYRAGRVVLYVTPSWEPNAGLQPGMGAPPAAIVEVEPGPGLFMASLEPCSWLLRL